MPNEEGLNEVSKLVTKFTYTLKSWIGPTVPLISLIHPDTVKPLVAASGIVSKPQRCITVSPSVKK